MRYNPSGFCCWPFWGDCSGVRSKMQITRERFYHGSLCSCWCSSLGTGIQGKTFVVTALLNATLALFVLCVALWLLAAGLFRALTYSLPCYSVVVALLGRLLYFSLVYVLRTEHMFVLWSCIRIQGEVSRELNWFKPHSQYVFY